MRLHEIEFEDWRCHSVIAPCSHLCDDGLVARMSSVIKASELASALYSGVSSLGCILDPWAKANKDS